MSQKQLEPEELSHKELKEQSSIKEASQKKIKRLKVAGQNNGEFSQSSEANLKIDSNQKV
jgi:phosphoheptose isomerase